MEDLKNKIMVLQYFLPKPTRKGAETEVRKRIAKNNEGKPKYKQIEVKSLRKKKSVVGGRPFYIAKLRKKK